MIESSETVLLPPTRTGRTALVAKFPRSRATMVIALATLAALLLVLPSLGLRPHPAALAPTRHSGASIRPVGTAPTGLVPAVEPQTFEALTPDEAEARNAARPLAKRPLEPARPFTLSVAGENALEWNRAVNCLALANYYEAASEGPAGMRAVSQVVLNRVRHPAFPKSVCEVVFQGSDRSTGCQFTFTCDGSLKRAAIPALMDRARAVAAAGLHGAVERGVGMATHYHTRQVVPYWAETLDKIRVVGAHIFYVWRGGAGSRSAFQGVYAGEGSAVADAFLPAEQRPAAMVGQPTQAAQAFQQNARQLDSTAAGGSRARRTFLVADEQPKGLLADDGANGKLEAQPLVHLSAQKIAPEPR